MNINKIKINSYGKLKNKEINLENNLNIIYGENESGKSTVLNFILNIFYGASKIKMEKKYLILKNISHGIQMNFQENYLMN